MTIAIIIKKKLKSHSVFTARFWNNLHKVRSKNKKTKTNKNKQKQSKSREELKAID
jgi:hypothetical protein